MATEVKEYEVVLAAQPEGGFVVTVPDLPGRRNPRSDARRGARDGARRDRGVPRDDARARLVGAHRRACASSRSGRATEKLPTVTPKQLIRILEKRGSQVDRIRGSHHVLVHPEQRRALVIAVHSRDLQSGTVTAIKRNAGISHYELRSLI